MPEMLPYGRQWLDEADVEAVVAVLRSDWLTQGPAIPRFETALAEVVGVAHAVAVSSGTAALHLAYLALGIGPGDAVVVPAITFAATANAVLYTGATPVFADIDPLTLGLSVSSAEAAIELALARGLRPKALAVVHYAGCPADLPGLAALAQAHGLVIVEDACHALGARYRRAEGEPFRHIGAGGVSAMACWSFHPVKHVTTGEGGAVTTDDPDLAVRLARLRSHGITKDPAAFLRPELALDEQTGKPNPWYHEMQELGFNYRLSDLQAALGTSQLAKLAGFIARRREIAERYRQALVGLPHLTLPPGDSPWTEHSYHLFPLHLDFAALGRSRAGVMGELQAQGIGTQVHYLPVFEHPFYQAQRDRWHQVACPEAARFYAGALSVPLFPAMGSADVDRVVVALRQAVVRR